MTTEIASIRKIIHLDCDCFYAAVEMRDNPQLRDKALAVGGSVEQRGVVATCNYAARAWGVHSAMATATALRKCPQLIVVAPRMQVYREASKKIHEIFKRYTQIIEPLSLDEAYLDVTACKDFQGSATWIAQAIRQQIEQEVGISASAGIAPNKFLAKVASDWNKPNGQFVVLPHQVEDFVKALAVKKIHGVGKVTNEKMFKLGIQTCADLQRLSRYDLNKHFGSFGEKLYLLARGIDQRCVKVQRVSKSISVERTFDKNIASLQACYAKLPELLEQLKMRCQNKSHKVQFKTLYIKIKFSDFSQTTVETACTEFDERQIKYLIKTGFERNNKALRLLGLGVRLHSREQVADDYLTQLPLF